MSVTKLVSAAGTLAVVLVTVLMVGIPFARHADAAPAAQLGPTESFTGCVTAVVLMAPWRVELERPAKTDPSQLERLIVELAPPQTAQVNEIITVSGQYEIPTKIFKAATVQKQGNCGPPPAAVSAASSEEDNDNDGNGDNDNRGNGNDNN